MSTDDEKTKLAKLLQGLEVPDIKLSERCSDLVKDFHQKFDQEVEDEEKQLEPIDMPSENPYIVDKELLKETEKKLAELLAQNKRPKKQQSEDVTANKTDPKRPWRINSNKEKLLRINNEIKHHYEKNIGSVAPLENNVMMELVRECEEDGRSMPPVSASQLKEAVNNAKKDLPNFQYKKIENSTATAILPSAHAAETSEPEPQNKDPEVSEQPA